MKNAGYDMSSMDCALKYLTAKDRTVWEIEKHLFKKQYSKSDIDATICRLIEIGLIDDRKYAEYFVQTRLASKPLSKEYLKCQLYSHHIDLQIIEEVLSKIDSDYEFKNACSIALKYYRQFNTLEDEKRNFKVLSRLQSRGFKSDISLKALENAIEHYSSEETAE